MLLSHHLDALLRALVCTNPAALAVHQIDLLIVRIDHRIRTVHRTDTAVVTDLSIHHRTKRPPGTGLSHCPFLWSTDCHLRHCHLDHLIVCLLCNRHIPGIRKCIRDSCLSRLRREQTKFCKSSDHRRVQNRASGNNKIL